MIIFRRGIASLCTTHGAGFAGHASCQPSRRNCPVNSAKKHDRVEIANKIDLG
jgi:hypothetical protein